ncbi:hypothetical protein OPV22_026386 [Ensete ventricosum]|uniref:VQ domain-containing protein n=1 Tax=Ensete ventricosum TaxID=4639 RepID=A0AAV8QLN9_ENSVE|nr:hypothetical protein OPV22_026386 [Ensete ventricosum]RWV80249.1 hypothetical protein GW17_00058509 [Ensete ventricosum]
MERTGVHPKCLKRSKAAKKTPIKVVYISDPMRVTTTVANFRSLVQSLTGRDSVLETTDDSSTASAPPSAASSTPSNHGVSCNVEQKNSLVAPVEAFDQAFVARMLENFPGFM